MHADPVALIFGRSRSSGYPDEREPDVVCEGVPTDTVLGLLCALGALRVLSRAWPNDDVRMAWQRKGGAWRPCIWAMLGKLPESEAEKRAQIVRAIADSLTTSKAVWWGIDDDPKMPVHLFRTKAFEALDAKGREYADWLAAYGCEVYAESDKDNIQDTYLSAMGRAGHQLLLKSIRELAEPGCTKEHHLHQALFGPWTYRDAKPYLRLDSRDDRSLAAYLAFDPQDKNAMSPILTVRGANRLAAESLVMFPTAPSSRAISTTGFTKIEGEDYFRFPLWDRPLTLAGVGAMLTHPDLLKPQPLMDRLRPLGVAAVLQSRRNQTDKGARSFLPVEQVW